MQTRRQRSWTCRGGFTLIEIMIVVAIIALLAGIAIPSVLRSRSTANESAAIGNLHTLANSLEMYRSVNNEYPLPASWGAAMYGACPGGAGLPNPDFGPPSFCFPMLANSLVQGFQYTYTGANCAATGCQSYDMTAVPQLSGTNGSRSLFVNSVGVIRHCTCPASGACPAADATDPSIDQPPVAC